MGRGKGGRGNRCRGLRVQRTVCKISYCIVQGIQPIFYNNFMDITYMWNLKCESGFPAVVQWVKNLTEVAQVTVEVGVQAPAPCSR